MSTSKHIQAIRMNATDISKTSFDQILKSSNSNLITYKEYIDEIEKVYKNMLSNVCLKISKSNSAIDYELSSDPRDQYYVLRFTLGEDEGTPINIEISHDAGESYDGLYSFGKMSLIIPLEEHLISYRDISISVVYPACYSNADLGVEQIKEILPIIKTKDYWDDFVFNQNETFDSISQGKIKDFESFKKHMPSILEDHFNKLIIIAKAIQKDAYTHLESENAIDEFCKLNADLKTSLKITELDDLGIKVNPFSSIFFRKANQLIVLTRERIDIDDILIDVLKSLDDHDIFRNLIEFDITAITKSVLFDHYEI